MQPNYKKLVQQLTGYSDKEYRAAYLKFAQRVRNFNRATGSDVKPAREFYYNFKYSSAPSKTLLAIRSTPATRPRAAGITLLSISTTQTAVDYIRSQWEGAYKASSTVRAIIDRIGFPYVTRPDGDRNVEYDGANRPYIIMHGKVEYVNPADVRIYTAADANRDLVRWADRLKARRSVEGGDPDYPSND